MENGKKTKQDNKKKSTRKSLDDLDRDFKTDGSEIHGGADVTITRDVAKG